MPGNIYEQGLEKNDANFASLSPLTFLERSAATFPNKTAIVHGPLKRTWAETYARCRKLASALTKRGIGKGDTVAVIASNTPEMYECAFGVPATGAVINTINTRLDAAAIAFILDHGEAKMLITDTEFSPAVEEALKLWGQDIPIFDIDDPLAQLPDGAKRLSDLSYEDLLAEGDEDFAWTMPADEWDAISLNYTSGTTGNPKGVVYHHRGAYLNALNNIVATGMGKFPVYLWTLPMFHCNGWCFPWTMAATAGVNVCLRKVNAANIYAAIAEEGVTHFCGAPIVLNFVINATEEEKRTFTQKVSAITAAAPPPAKTLQSMKDIGFEVTHVYGLTETYGPACICDWDTDWDDLPIEEQTRLKGRQGVRYHVLEGIEVMDATTMTPVPRDGATPGEIMFRGNIVMKGYLKNEQATKEAFEGGWFHSGDVAVMQPDGYIKIQDRAKDVIISGGENISSIEIEDAIYQHPSVLSVAVVAKHDEKWGETPCAFVELKSGFEDTTEEEIISFCREKLAKFKCPRHVVFTELPKTSTGKIQKFKLRDQELQFD
ncbi:MAG: acyl-CoA synthetase [Magnetovibrionaceae bacterium]